MTEEAVPAPESRDPIKKAALEAAIDHAFQWGHDGARNALNPEWEQWAKDKKREVFDTFELVLLGAPSSGTPTTPAPNFPGYTDFQKQRLREAQGKDGYTEIQGAAGPPNPPSLPRDPLAGKRLCTCLGSCRGRASLARGWWCAADAKEGTAGPPPSAPTGKGEEDLDGLRPKLEQIESKTREYGLRMKGQATIDTAYPRFWMAEINGIVLAILSSIQRGEGEA